MTNIRETALVLALALAVSLVAAVGMPVVKAQAEETLEPYYKTMWAAKRANVRAGPSTSFEKVGLLEVGERVTVVARSGEWFKLFEKDGQSRRFVYAPLLTEHDAAEAQELASLSAPKTINYSNGDRYHGQLRFGKRHGRGVYTWASGGSYDGEWRDGDFHGRGTRIYANGNRYEGDFVNDERTGRGVFTWASGDRYDGGFVDGRVHGAGTYTYADGTRIAGRFRDGAPHDYATGQQVRDAMACIDRRGNDRYRNTCRTRLLFFYCFTETDGHVETCGRPHAKEARGKPEHYYTHLEYLSPGETHEVPYGDEFPYRWVVCPYPDGEAPYHAVSAGDDKYKCRTHWRSFSNDKQAAHSKLARRAEELERQRQRERELARQRERERELARQREREWERQEAEWEAERERERAETWNNINRNLQNSLNTIEMLRGSGSGSEPSGGYAGSSGSDCHLARGSCNTGP